MMSATDGAQDEAQDSGRGGAPRRKFTPEEDLHLRSLVEQLGTKHWEEISRYLPDRSARQCRNRYKNYLLDSLITNPWTPEEDAIVIAKFHQIGPKWVEIGKLLSGRSGNNVKNRWYKHLCKTDIGATPAAPDPRTPSSVAQSIGWSDKDWPKLFAYTENPLQMEWPWSSGKADEHPLF
jgi:hypothetical protein